MTASMGPHSLYDGTFKGTFDLEGKLKPLTLTDEYGHTFKGTQTRQIQVAPALFQEVAISLAQMEGSKKQNPKNRAFKQDPGLIFSSERCKGPSCQSLVQLFRRKINNKTISLLPPFHWPLFILKAKKSIVIKHKLKKRSIFSYQQ